MKRYKIMSPDGKAFCQVNPSDVERIYTDCCGWFRNSYFAGNGEAFVFAEAVKLNMTNPPIVAEQGYTLEQRG